MAKLDVLYQFDENYAAIGGVSITTLFKNNTDIEELTVYIAAKDVSAENLKKLDMLAAQYQRRIVYLNVERIYDRLNRLGANGWNGSLATWMKVFVVQEIPETVEQLLYIDSDTLVLASLRELAEIDMGNHMVAAVIDSISRGSAERLRLDTPYFNAGLLLLNFPLWRKEDTVRRMHLHLSQHIAEYLVNDQDLINDYFRGRILKLNPRYNFQGTHFFIRTRPTLVPIAGRLAITTLRRKLRRHEETLPSFISSGFADNTPGSRATSIRAGICSRRHWTNRFGKVNSTHGKSFPSFSR